MKVAFTYRAERDLEAIGDWIAQDNPTRAKSFVVELREACMRLADNPRAFPILSRHRTHAIRRKAYRNYLILYRIAGETIEVWHVIHGARDYETILSEDFD